MGRIKAAGRWVWRHRLSAWTVVLGVALGWVLSVMHNEQRHTDAVARVAAIATADNAAQNDRIEALVHQLEVETRERTTESCHNSQISRDGTIELWLNVLNFLTPRSADGAPMPTPTIEHLTAIVQDAYPPVACPQDQGPIVIPVPSTTGAP